MMMCRILSRQFLPAILCLSWISGITVADDQSQKKRDSEELTRKIENLINRLDDDDFDVREESEKHLIKIGKPALNAVQKAAKSPSAEVRFRAEKILKQLPITDKVFYIDFQPQGTITTSSLFGDIPDPQKMEEDKGLLPRGEKVLGNVKFKIDKKCIQLSGNEFRKYSTKVEGIKVGKSFLSLHFLHATGWSVNDGVEIGYYRIHFEDKKVETVPIVYGEHVRDWYNWNKLNSIKNGVMAWHGEQPDIRRQYNVSIRLFRSSWKNPRPKVKVVKIDYVSKNTKCAPFCVAMSAALD